MYPARRLYHRLLFFSAKTHRGTKLAIIPHEANGYRPHALRSRSLKVYSAALIAAKVFLTGFLFVSYPTEAQFAELTASKIFELTNASRAENGAKQLRLSATLTRAAQAKAQDMLRLGYFDHTGPDGKKFWQWIKESGYSYSIAGENLAMDFTTAESAHRALMASVSHRNNILKSSYVDMGVAVLEGTMDDRETTVLVEYFGTPLATPRIAQQPLATGTAPTPGQQAPAAAQPATKSAAQYRAQLVGVSDEKFILLANSEISVWADFKNTGSTTWWNDRGAFVALNVTNPPGRTSAFQHSSWPAAYRPTRLLQKNVRPGEIGRLVFTLRAPKTPLTATESFGLVAENLTWVPGGSVTLPITVIQPQPSVASAQTAQPSPQAVVDQHFDTTVVQVVKPETQQQAVIPVETVQPTPLVVTLPSSQLDWRQIVTVWTIRFFWAFLFFLSISLILTIIIRIRIQHRHVILQTLLVLVLAVFMISIPFHYAERIASIFVS
ncbi:MAG: CAP domain-containing protein [bacterium]